jgi:hypothetical protein
MSDARYRLITAGEARRLDAAAASVMGRSLQRIIYRTWLEPGRWPHDGYPATEQLHQLDDSVLLVFDGGTLMEIGGVAPGFSWGIDVHIIGASRPPADRLDDDVSSTPGWAPLLDRRIEMMAAGWMQNDEGEPATVCALHLDLSGGRSVVIALGWIEAGVPRIHPDNLVVVFDENAARAYGALGAMGTFDWKVVNRLT